MYITQSLTLSYRGMVYFIDLLEFLITTLFRVRSKAGQRVITKFKGSIVNGQPKPVNLSGQVNSSVNCLLLSLLRKLYCYPSLLRDLMAQ